MDVHELYTRYQSGQSLRQIAKASGVPYHKLFYHFRKHRLPLRTDSESLHARYDNDAETARMYADYQAGMSVEEVGRKYFYAASVVWKRFQHHGLKTRKRGERF